MDNITKEPCGYQFYQLPKIAHYLNGNEWKVFTIIFDKWTYMKNEDGYFFRSWKELCTDTGLASATLDKCIKSLILKKFIEKKTYAKGQQKANDYKINIEFISSFIPTSKNEVAYFKKRSTTKEVSTKEKYNNNNTLVYIVPGTGNTETGTNVTKNKTNSDRRNDMVPGSDKVKMNLSKIISKFNEFITSVRDFNADCSEAVSNGKAAIKYYKKHKTSASERQRETIEGQIYQFERALRDRKKYIGSNLNKEERKKLDTSTEEYQISIGNKVVWNYAKALQYAEEITAGEATTDECITQMKEYIEWHTAATTSKVVQSYKELFSNKVMELRGLQPKYVVTNSAAAGECADLPF